MRKAHSEEELMSSKKMLNLTTENWVSQNIPYRRNIDKKYHATFVCIKVALVMSID